MNPPEWEACDELDVSSDESSEEQGSGTDLPRKVPRKVRLLSGLPGLSIAHTKLSYSCLIGGRARAQRRECATGKLVKLQPKKARPFDRVMSLVCREAGLAINGQSRPAVKMALRLLHLGRCFGLRYPQGHQESIPATLRTKHCWATAVCAAVIGISVGEEVHCSSSNSAQFAKAEKWKALAEGVRSAVEEALLSALKTLPFGANVQKEELCLFIKSLLEFYPELLNAAPAGEGSDFEDFEERPKIQAVAKAKPQGRGFQKRRRMAGGSIFGRGW